MTHLTHPELSTTLIASGAFLIALSWLLPRSMKVIIAFAGTVLAIIGTVIAFTG